MDNREVVIRDVPVFLWIFGVGFFGFGIFMVIAGSAPLWAGALFFLFGAGIVLFVPIVTVRHDRSGGVLRVEKIAVVRRKIHEIAVHRIERVDVDHKISTDDGRTSHTYRVVIVEEDGVETPLRTSYSSGRNKKLQQAEAIRQAIGVGGDDESPMDFGANIEQAIRLHQVEDQEAQTGIPIGEQESDGVRWQLESFEYGGAQGGSLVYRWSSTNFETPDYFLFLAQRVEGVGKQKGLMNLVGNLLIKQSIKMYGFDEYFTPGVDKASPVEGIDRRLDQYFFVYSSDQEKARKLLNPWTVMPLVGWADRYALEKRSKNFHQLSVLFSPLGVYVSVLNTLDAAQVDELVALGIELVRAQGG